MENWDVEKVCEFLKSHKFEGDVAEIFRRNKIGGEVLPLLDTKDMKTLGLSDLGDRKRLQTILEKRSQNSTQETSVPARLDVARANTPPVEHSVNCVKLLIAS